MKHVNIAGFDVIEAQGTYAEACALVQVANADKVGWNTDWVMPDTMTLLALQKLAPAVAWVYSSSPFVGFSDGAWGVGFSDGNVGGVSRNYGYHVRLVRASQLLEIGIAGHKVSIEDAEIVLPEQPTQQEPVGVFREDDDIGRVELIPHQQIKLKDGDKLYTAPQAQPAQQETVLCCGKYETCNQACTPRGRFLGKRETVAKQAASAQPTPLPEGYRQTPERAEVLTKEQMLKYCADRMQAPYPAQRKESQSLESSRPRHHERKQMNAIWQYIGSPAYWTHAAFITGIYLTIAVLGKTSDWLFAASIAIGFYLCWKFSANKKQALAEATHNIKENT